MRCREAKYWLYSFRTNASWPADVVGHIQQCQSCRQLQTQLQQIDAGVERLTSPTAASPAKDKLLQRIQHTPQEAGGFFETMPSSVSGWYQFGGYLLGSAALIALGCFVGSQLAPTPDPVETVRLVERIREVPGPKVIIREPAPPMTPPKVAPESPERALFASLLKHNAQLVQEPQVADRLATLLDMADDCRQHAVNLIANGPRELLPTAVDLYTHLLNDGVLVQYASVPADERPAIQTSTRARLEKMAERDNVPAELPRVVEEQWTALRTATTKTMDYLANPDAVLAKFAKKVPRFDGMPPTTALVQFAIAYSTETDAVAKADSCAHCVNRLMPTMMLCLAEDASPQRAEMGQQFGEMIRYGVYTSLETATASKPPPAVMEKAERIFESADRTVADMQKHLDKVPQNAKPGLQRAVDASKRGKGGEKGNGKGTRSVSGTLKSIKGNSITVSARISGQVSEQTFTIQKGTHVIVNARTAAISDLRSGMSVQMRLSDDRRSVLEIREHR